MYGTNGVMYGAVELALFAEQQQYDESHVYVMTALYLGVDQQDHEGYHLRRGRTGSQGAVKGVDV